MRETNANVLEFFGPPIFLRVKCEEKHFVSLLGVKTRSPTKVMQDFLPKFCVSCCFWVVRANFTSFDPKMAKTILYLRVGVSETCKPTP